MQKYFVIIVFALVLGGCGEKVIEEDNLYAQNLIKERLYSGLSFSDAERLFSKYDRKIHLFRECNEPDYEKCPNLSIGTVPLKSDHWWLGKGDIQIYMVFDKQLKLTSADYELYYARFH